MKGKTTMTIIIGLICVVLVAVMFAQFKTISRIDVTALENMQEAELRSEITSWKTRYEEIVSKLEDTNEKITEYKDNVDNNRKTSELLTSELNQLQGLVGLTSVSGSGVVVTLSDNEIKKISADDLLELVNELKLAGAEAISICDERNESRIVYNSYIVDLGTSGFITVGGIQLSSPYTVKAIGNPTYLESGLSKKQYGYIDKKKANNITVELERQDNITINAYSREFSFKQAKNINEQ